MSSSTFVRRQLGARLRKLREDARMSQEDVAATELLSRVTLWRTESGQRPSRWGTIRALCEMYGADPATTTALVELAKASKGTGWYERYGDAVPETLQIFMGAELAARRIFHFDPEVVYGALQTEDYTLALFRGESPDSSPEHLDRLLAARRERKERFWSGRPDDAVLCVVLNEAALVREVGGRETMCRQVDHLKEASGQRGVEVRVLRWSAGAHPAIYGGYTLFEFRDHEDPTVVFAENYAGGQYMEDEHQVRRMLDVWQRIHDPSVPVKEYT